MIWNGPGLGRKTFKLEPYLLQGKITPSWFFKFHFFLINFNSGVILWDQVLQDRETCWHVHWRIYSGRYHTIIKLGLILTKRLVNFQLGDEKYAVFAIMGPTLCFELPSNYHRDNITEKVCLSTRQEYVFNCVR